MKHPAHAVAAAALVAVALLLAACADSMWTPDTYERHYSEPDVQEPPRESVLLDPGNFLAEYPEKIVYTTDRDVDVAVLRTDCENRDGVFNECGSPCAEGEVCVEVCAYTCELPQS
jgi:hypothetical protein